MPAPRASQGAMGQSRARAMPSRAQRVATAAVSMLGIALGVAALIVVLSVMNGFQEELRNRILSVASHIEVRGLSGGLEDWHVAARAAQADPHVRGAAPFVVGQAMLSAGNA